MSQIKNFAETFGDSQKLTAKKIILTRETIN